MVTLTRHLLRARPSLAAKGPAHKIVEPVSSRQWLPQRQLQSRLPLHRNYVSAPYGYEQAKALVYSQHGEPKDVLSLHNHSISPPHSNLLTLRLLTSPINPADINTVQGTYPSKPPFTTLLGTQSPSAVPGNEGCAEVLSCGAEASKAPHNIQKGDWVIMKRPMLGTWRTHLQVPADEVIRLGNESERGGITAVQAATVSVNPCTAYAMLRGYVGGSGDHSGKTLEKGQWFIQNGANSGVGRAAIQLGAAWGLHSINLIRSRPGGEEETNRLKEELKGLGADIVLTEEDAQDSKSFASTVKEATQGNGVDLALNCVGGRSAISIAKPLNMGAWHVTYGAMAKQPVSVPAGFLIFKDIRFAGFWVSRWGEVLLEEKKKAVEEVLKLTREGKFKDAPMREVKWDWKTGEEGLREEVQGTLEGFRDGKGVFVFKDT